MKIRINKLLKYIGFIFFLNLLTVFMVGFIVLVLRIFINNTLQPFLLSNEGYLTGYIIMWIIFISLFYLIIQKDGFNDFSTGVYNNKMFTVEIGIAVLLYIISSLFLIGKSDPPGITGYFYMAHSALAYFANDCFISCFVLSIIDFFILLFAYNHGKSNCLKRYPALKDKFNNT